jgi:hypothetical protein
MSGLNTFRDDVNFDCCSVGQTGFGVEPIIAFSSNYVETILTLIQAYPYHGGETDPDSVNGNRRSSGTGEADTTESACRTSSWATLPS